MAAVEVDSVLQARLRALAAALSAASDAAPPEPGSEPVTVHLRAGEPALPLGLAVTASSGHGPESEHVVERDVEFLSDGEGTARRLRMSGGPEPRSSEAVDEAAVLGRALWERLAEFFEPLLSGPALPGEPPLPADRWEARKWEVSYELLDRRTGTRSFQLGGEVPEETHRVVRTIDHDHCDFCMSPLSTAPEHWTEGWHHPERGWICPPCHVLRIRSEAG